MSLWVQCAIAAAIAAAGFTSGWQVRAWKAGADDAERLQLEARDAQRRSDKAIDAAAGYEAAKDTQRPKTIIVTREVQRAVQSDLGCSVQPLPSGLRDALVRAARVDQPGPDSAMPSASAAGAFDLGRSRAGLLRSVGGTGRLPSQTQSTQ